MSPGLVRKMTESGLLGGTASSRSAFRKDHSKAPSLLESTTTYKLLWLHPDGSLRRAITITIAALVVWSVYTVPCFIAFDITNERLSTFWFVEFAVDIAFAFEILANFRTGIWLDGATEPCYDLCYVAKTYVRGSFFVDMLATVPGLVESIIDLTDSDGVSASTLSILQMVRALRLSKLLRWIKLNKVVKQYADTKALRFAYLVQGMFLVGHLIGCLLHFYNTVEDGCTDSDDPSSGAASAKLLCTWVDLLRSSETDGFSRYIASVFWAFTAMSTVGYGDIVPVNMGEAGIVLLAEFAGVLSFASVVGTMHSLTTLARGRQSITRDKTEFVGSFMRENHLPRELQMRIRKFYEYSLGCNPLLDVENIFAELSKPLREQLAQQMYGKYYDTFPLLQRKGLTFLSWIGPRLQAFYVVETEFVLYSDVVALDMYWLYTGTLEVLTADLSATLYLMWPGDTFGEVQILNRQLHGVTIRARTACSMLFLSRATLLEAIDSVPSLQIDLLRQAQAQHTKRISELENEGVPAVQPAQYTQPVITHHDDRKTAPLRWWIIVPTMRFKTRWDLLMGLLIMYSAAIVPMRLGFLPDTPEWSIHDAVIDSVFVVDMLLYFITAFEDADGNTIDSPRLIARHYIFSVWFTIDLISVFPFELITGSIDDEAATSPTDICDGQFRGGSDGFKAVKLLRTVRLMRLAKIVRVLKLKRTLRSLQRLTTANPAIIQLVLLFAFIFFFTHLVGCIWAFSTQIGEEANWARSYPPYTTKLTEKAICWPPLYKYLASIYWAFTTLSTIGFGDLTPVNTIEQIMALIVMFFGSGFFGVLLSRMSDLITAIDAAGYRKNMRFDTLNVYLRSSQLPSTLQRRLHKYYSYYLDEGANFGVQEEVLKELSPQLRTEVLLHLNKDLVAEIPFFKGQHPGFVVSVCSMLVPCFALAQEYIFTEGEQANEMFLLQRGRIQIRCSKLGEGEGGTPTADRSQEIVLDEQEAVSYFGEVPLLEKNVKNREASVLALTFCSLFTFSRENLTELLHLFPSVQQALLAVARQRKERFEIAQTLLLTKKAANKFGALRNKRAAEAPKHVAKTSSAEAKKLSLARKSSLTSQTSHSSVVPSAGGFGCNSKAVTSSEHPNGAGDSLEHPMPASMCGTGCCIELEA